MTTAELQAQISAMRESIQAQQERLDELEKQLENAKLDDISKPLQIEDSKATYFVTTYGDVYSSDSIAGELYQIANNRHRLFKSEKYAEMYREKTQHIADLLHFKWLYDRDYEPDWRHAQWTISKYDDKYVPLLSGCERDTDVYFTNKEIAQKGADWLNRKAGRNE